jgi:serine/threonine protein kinase
VKIFEGGDVDGLIAEVQNLVLLPRHPNIVQLVGFSIHGKHDKPMLVMELLDGDLHSLVCTDDPKKKQRLTQTLSGLWKKLSGQLGLSTHIKIDFIYQIAKGMLFLHNRKIFHGDLKGKNVLVKQLPGDRIQLKVADFGLSEKLLIKREHSDSDSSIELNCSHHSNHSSLGFRRGSGKGKAQVLGNVGTLRWMAPEVYGVAGGDIKPYSMKADVYSFAMTCVEILTRQHPFPDIHSPKEIRQYVNSGGRPNLQMVKDVPQALLMLVETCWNADPFCRPDFSKIYSRMQELKKQFPIN